MQSSFAHRLLVLNILNLEMLLKSSTCDMKANSYCDMKANSYCDMKANSYCDMKANSYYTTLNC